MALDAQAPGGGWRTAFRLGVTAGLVYFAGTLYWVVDVMSTYGGLAPYVAAPVGMLLVAYLAIYPGLFAAVVAVAVRRRGIGAIWWAPLVWVTTEWLRGWVAGGFPWVLLGSSQAAVLPVVQLASVTGVFGLSALVALVGTAAAALSLSRRRADRVGAALAGALLVGVAVAGTFRVTGGTLTASGRVLRVGLLQGNVDQAEKWDPRFRGAILNRYLDLARQVIDAGAQVVVWPEASMPFYFDLERAWAEPVRRLAAETRTPMILGTDEYRRDPASGAESYFNSALLVGDDGRSRESYQKMRLVPFGEYVPFRSLLFFVGPLVEKVSAFTAGTRATVLDTGRGRISTAICYESVVPSVSRAFVRGGSQLLATITNDAWFGRSSAAHQHWEQGAIRAVEQGRYIVRAANTGVSGAVDPYGRTILRTDLFEATSRVVDVRLHDGLTLYARAGDVIVWIGLLVTVGLVATGRRQRTAA